ncbi:MAG TPA: tyrosine-type recombinase/integrase [Firmicutes bacterium]|nr:tyrosine-type recombinase/integrase [Bacillota bacterium]
MPADRTPPSARDYGSCVEEFLDELRLVGDKSPATLDEYHRDLVLFWRFLTGRDQPEVRRSRRPALLAAQRRQDAELPPVPISEIGPREVRRFLLYLQDRRGNSRHGVARKVSALRAFFSFLRRQGVIAVDPMADIPRPKINPRAALRKHLNKEDALRLLDYVKQQSRYPERDLALFALFLYGGLRISEAVSLRPEDIKFGENLVEVLHAKGRKQRAVPLPDDAMATLRWYVERRRYPEAPWLFTNRRGGRLSRSSGYFIVKQFVKALGLDPAISPHKLRHTCATLLLEAGVDLRFIQEFLGHADISTTQIYAHVTAAKLREVILEKNPLSRS